MIVFIIRYVQSRVHFCFTVCTPALALFQKRIEFGSQNACMINVWGYAEMLSLLLCIPRQSDVQLIMNEH